MVPGGEGDVQVFKFNPYGQLSVLLTKFRRLIKLSSHHPAHTSVIEELRGSKCTKVRENLPPSSK
jgi:hypothetical protein